MYVRALKTWLATALMIVAGTNGGLAQIWSDGNVDFSANGEFDHLGAEDTAFTTFVYTIEGGAEATLTVEITGDTGGGGPIIIG